MGDIVVRLDSLKAHSERFQDHINAMEDLLEEILRGPIQQALNDGSRFGGFEQAKILDTLHRQLADELMWLQRQLLGGLMTAKGGIEQTMENYRGVDEQRRREFAEIEKLLPE